MSSTTATANISNPVSLDELVKAMEEAKAMFKPPEWVLIAPDGRVFKGDQRTVAIVLFQNLDIASLFPAPTGATHD